MAALYFTPYSIDLLLFGTLLTNVNAGAYSVPSAQISNMNVRRTKATLVLTFSNPLTAGSGSPYVGVYPLLLPDGLTYPTPPGNNAAAPSPNAYQIVSQVVASTAYSTLVFPNIELEPANYAYMFYNNTGVNWSGGGVINATLYTYSYVYV